MSKNFELQAENRLEFGKGASRRLRRQGDKVPAIMYGGGEPAAPLAFNHKQLSKALENEAFYSHILTIQIDGKKQKAVLKDLQRHPYKPRILHMDLLRITGKEKIHMQVPLHFLGEESAPGLKESGIISHLLTTVEIRCLPDDLPEFIEVDLSNLNLDDSIHLSHLKLSKGVELVALVHGNDQPVASIHLPRAALVEEAEAAAEATTAAATVAPEAGKAAPAAAKAPAASGDKNKEKGK